MMSFTKKLDVIKNTLLGIADTEIPIYHYWRPAPDDRYIIWEEDGEIALESDNHKSEQGATGSIDLYTKDERDPCFDMIQEALDSTENVAWYYDGTDFENDTNFIHHNWRWTVI